MREQCVEPAHPLVWILRGPQHSQRGGEFDSQLDRAARQCPRERCAKVVLLLQRDGDPDATRRHPPRTEIRAFGDVQEKHGVSPVNFLRRW